MLVHRSLHRSSRGGSAALPLWSKDMTLVSPWRCAPRRGNGQRRAPGGMVVNSWGYSMVQIGL